MYCMARLAPLKIVSVKSALSPLRVGQGMVPWASASHARPVLEATLSRSVTGTHAIARARRARGLVVRAAAGDATKVVPSAVELVDYLNASWTHFHAVGGSHQGYSMTLGRIPGTTSNFSVHG
jgi:hypothetical protein